LTPLVFFYFILQKMNYHTNICECVPVFEFEEDPFLFLCIVQTGGGNAQVQRAQGVPVTVRLYRQLVYHAYIVAVFGWLGRGNRHPPKACLVELVQAEWSEHSASAYIGYHALAAAKIMDTGAKPVVDEDGGGPSSSSWPTPTAAEMTDNGVEAGLGHVSLKPTDGGGPSSSSWPKPTGDGGPSSSSS
jgi:hypothetical protein